MLVPYARFIFAVGIFGLISILISQIYMILKLNRDYFNSQSIVIIEWPTRGEPLLPQADLVIDIQLHPQQGRILLLTAHNSPTIHVLNALDI